MNLSDIIQHIPHGSAQDTAIKVSGFLGGGSAFAGLTADLSGWSEVAQILANMGIFIGGLAALITICYTMYRGRKGGK